MRQAVILAPEVVQTILQALCYVSVWDEFHLFNQSCPNIVCALHCTVMFWLSIWLLVNLLYPADCAYEHSDILTIYGSHHDSSSTWLLDFVTSFVHTNAGRRFQTE